MLRLSNRTRGCALLTALTMLTAGTSLADGQLALDEHGLGGLNSSTPFDLPTLRDLMPVMVWQERNQQTEDGHRPVLRAALDGKTAFTLSGDGRGGIAAIEIVSRRIGNHLGPRVGDQYRTARQSGYLGVCWPGMEARSGRVLCEAAQSGRIAYVFAGRWSGPDGRMPPASALDAWNLSKMVWRPDRFAQIGEPPVENRETGPAFDCSKARGSVEEMICRSAELARLDRRLTVVYAETLAAATPAEQRLLRAEQRGWIKGRNDCWKSSGPHQCVVGVYNDRIAELSTETVSLPGTAWTGLRIAGDTIPRDIDINLTFGHDGTITGSSGCNRFFASYDLDGRNLEVNAIGGTRRMCPEIEMLAERRFLDALEKVDGWAMRRDNLILFGTGAELTFRRM